MAQQKHSLAYRLQHVAGLLAKYQSNPGLRSKLPDSLLTPQQLASRKHNQFLAGISNPGSTLQGPDLVNAAHQITDSDFAPLLGDIGNQEKVVNQSRDTQQGWAKRYYGDLSSLFGSIVGAQDKANAVSAPGAAALAKPTLDAIGASDAGAQQRMAADAATRGADLQGTAAADLAARTAGQQQLAQTEAQRANDSATATGGAQAAFLRGLQGATAQQGGEYQQKLSDAAGALLQKLAANRSDLQQKQAGAFTDTLLKLRQQEAYNAYTRAGLNLTAAKIDAASQPSPSDQKTMADLAFFQKHGYYPQTGPTKGPSASDRKTQQEIDFFNKHGYYPTTGPGKKGGRGGSGDGTSDVGKAQDASTGAISAGSNWAKQNHIPLDKAHRHQLTDFLMSAAPSQSQSQSVKDKNGVTHSQTVSQSSKKGYDALWASIAADILIDGHVSRYNAGRLHSRGLTVKDLGLRSYSDSTKGQTNGGGASTYGGRT